MQQRSMAPPSQQVPAALAGSKFGATRRGICAGAVSIW
jgi:hypothetical protein